MTKEDLEKIRAGIIEQKKRLEVLKKDIADAERAGIPMYDQRRRMVELETRIHAMEAVYMKKEE